jgi:hypothetical protein
MSEPVDYKNLNESKHDDSDAWTTENDHAEEDAEDEAEQAKLVDADEDDDEEAEEKYNNDHSELY